MVASYDHEADCILNGWVDEHHVGALADASIVLVVDLREHAFMVDYAPSEKEEYVGAFFRNLNWDVVQERFEELR